MNAKPDGKGKPGRPPGTVNKRSATIIEAAQASGLLPHEILLSFARGERQVQRMENPQTGEITEVGFFPDPNMRASCANMAAPYFAPKLAQVQHRMKDERDPNSIKDADLIEIALGSGGDDKRDDE